MRSWHCDIARWRTGFVHVQKVKESFLTISGIFLSKNLVIPRKSRTCAPTNPTTLLVARPADQGGTFLLYMEYTKQPITLAEQINILKQRGLTFEDENAALRILNHISYFRLLISPTTVFIPSFAVLHTGSTALISRTRLFRTSNLFLQNIQVCKLPWWVSHVDGRMSHYGNNLWHRTHILYI